MSISESDFHYHVVDVFTQNQFEGNALAVFPHAVGLDANTMQRIARELNLTETVFVFPSARSDCQARLRIFSPLKELDFAGHPTIGTAFVLLDEGRVDRGRGAFLLEENVGPVPIRVEDGPSPMLWLCTPPIKFGPCYDSSLCASVLGLADDDLLSIVPQRLSAGNPTVFVALRDKEAVDRACLDPAGMKRLHGSDPEAMCVFVFTPTAEGVYARMFAPDYGIAEDPATGSSTGPLAAFMMHHQLVPPTAGTRFVSEQGKKMGRRSLLHVHIRGENGSEGIEVGGHATPVAKACLHLRVTG